MEKIPDLPWKEFIGRNEFPVQQEKLTHHGYRFRLVLISINLCSLYLQVHNGALTEVK